MKIIGQTETGSHLVEMTTVELINLNAAAQTLKGLRLEIPEEPEAVITCTQNPPRSGTSRTTPPEEGIKSGGKKLRGERICAWCKKALPRNAGPLMKRHKGKCQKEYNREYALKLWRAKHGKKPFGLAQGGSEQIAGPGLPVADDREFKARRLGLIKAAVEKTAGMN